MGMDEAACSVRTSEDMRRIAALRLRSVLLEHLDDSTAPAAIRAAREAGLEPFVADRSIRDYVLLNALPVSCRDVNGVVRSMGEPGGTIDPAVGVVVDAGQTSDTMERAKNAFAAIERSGRPALLWDRGNGALYRRPPPPPPKDVGQPASPIEAGHAAESSFDAIAVISTTTFNDRPPGQEAGLLLSAYHEALAQGRTGGLLIDRFQRIPGDPPGLLPGGSASPPSRTAAVAALVDRASNWGSRLIGFAVAPVRSAKAPLDVSVLAFVHGPRRFVLVYNRSAAVHGRGEVVVASEGAVGQIRRAVEVPGGGDSRGGTVLTVHGGTIVIPVSLRPGDAALFELF